jgi:hypothetical protein
LFYVFFIFPTMVLRWFCFTMVFYGLSMVLICLFYVFFLPWFYYVFFYGSTCSTKVLL